MSAFAPSGRRRDSLRADHQRRLTGAVIRPIYAGYRPVSRAPELPGLLARAMRERQPLREPARSFVWCRSVERHHCVWEAWRATELRAPSVADGHDLDVVRTPVNRFVEAKSFV